MNLERAAGAALTAITGAIAARTVLASARPALGLAATGTARLAAAGAAVAAEAALRLPDLPGKVSVAAHYRDLPTR